MAHAGGRGAGVGIGEWFLAGRIRIHGRGFAGHHRPQNAVLASAGRGTTLLAGALAASPHQRPEHHRQDKRHNRQKRR